MPNIEKINGIGRISRVTTKFCYVSSNMGPIFCPLAHAVRPDMNIPNLSEIYQEGDQVSFSAIKQEPKNGCSLLALKVRHKIIKNTEVLNEVLHGIAVVNVVTETYAYGTVSDNSIFIPGAAFSATEVTRLNSYLRSGDSLQITYRIQTEHNSCKYLAISASKIREDICSGTCSGLGRIISVTEHCAFVMSDSKEEILCPIITWTGGSGPHNSTWLTELVSAGEVVCFSAVRYNGKWRATDWYLPKCKLQNTVSSTGTQTMPSSSVILIDILRPAIEEMALEKPILKVLLDSL